MIATLTRWRWAALALLLALSLATAGWMARRPLAEKLLAHPYFIVDRVAIHGVGPALTPEDVTAWLGFDATTTVWEASPGRVRARLEAHPYIARAAVRRIFPGRLEIDVRERAPLAIAVLDDLFYVDRSGATFGPLRSGDTRDLPLVTGLDGAARGTRSWMLRRALRLLHRCERAPASTACAGPLSEVHVDPEDGVTVYPASPRVPLVLGWGSWSTKLARAARALRAWEGDTARLARLDLRFRNQVVATVRPTAAPPPPPPPRARTRGGGLKA